MPNKDLFPGVGLYRWFLGYLSSMYISLLPMTNYEADSFRFIQNISFLFYGGSPGDIKNLEFPRSSLGLPMLDSGNTLFDIPGKTDRLKELFNRHISKKRKF